MLTESIQTQLLPLTYSAIPVMLGLLLHEVAHGYAAYLRGDSTAKFAGRLTLNPLPHIDPMGLLMFVVTALTGPFVFGWAKPVPVNMRYFKNPKRDMILVAAAGPLTNLILAFLFAGLLKLLITLSPQSAYASTSFEFFFLMCKQGVLVNLALAWFNLIPIPPLDGSRIVAGLLPNDLAYKYARLERYGFLLLILILMTDISGKILYPPIRASLSAILTVTGLN